MNKFKNIISIILFSCGIICLVAASYFIVQQVRMDKQHEEILEALQPDPLPALEAIIEEPIIIPVEETVMEEPTINAIKNPYQESFLLNEDMAAWIQIPDTNIDYPIMWTPRDENYYLNRDFFGNENNNGCLILDTDSALDPRTTNLIIHGHNMKSGEMFGNLTAYEDYDYFNTHRYIHLFTESGKYEYEIIAVFRSQVFKKSDTVFKYYQFFDAETEADFMNFYQNVKNMSLYDTDVIAEFGNRFITLSTCVYHVDRGRFVVVAKELGMTEEYLSFKE